METCAIIKELTSIPSPSGFEENAQSAVKKIISPYVDEVTDDVQGNLICRRFAKTTKFAKNIMLMAHIDEVGMMVTHVEPSGFIRFSKIGGVDPQLLQGHRVIILHNNSYVNGVVGALPIHMKNKDIQKSSLQFTDLWIDIGAVNREEAFQKIQIGDPIIIDNTTIVLSDDVISSRACDDKAGVAALLLTAKMLKGKDLSNNIVFVTSVQEEIGMRGAIVASYNIQPDVCIVIDVTHATDYPSVQKSQYGEINIGAGVAIPVGSDLSVSMQHKLIELATKMGIPFQRFALPGASGTDAHAAQVSRGGCLTGLVSIPCRYMHSPVECVSPNDVKKVAELLTAFCEQW